MTELSISRVAVTGGLLALGLNAALADEYHNVNQIVGDRAMGIAGAYTAVSDDPAGLFYNPAGLVFADDSSISASVNTLQYRQIDYDDVLAGQYDWQRGSVQLLPNFFGVIQDLGPFKVGISSSIPDSVSENQDQQFSDFGSVKRYVINLNRQDIRYNFGPGLAYELNEFVSLGLVLNYHYRVVEFNLSQYVRLDDDTLEWSSTYLETTEHGLRPKFGVMWSPADRFAFGLTVDRPFVMQSETQYQEALCATETGAEGCKRNTAPDIATYDDRRDYPWQVRAGVAWFPSPSLLLAGDLVYHNATEASLINGAREETLDVALGAEYYWSPRYAVRGGFYTARANTPELSEGKTRQEPHLDVYGLTASLSRFTQDSSVSIGLVYGAAQGQSQLFADAANLLQDTTLRDASAFISTSYRY